MCKEEFRVGVLKGTTTREEAKRISRTFLTRSGGWDREQDIEPVVVLIDSHDQGINQLVQSTDPAQPLDAYLADREILLALRNRLAKRDAEGAGRLIVSKDYFTFEPYAIGLQPGQRDLRFIANSVLGELFRWNNPRQTGDHIFTELRRYFPGKKFNQSLQDLYRLQRLPVGSPFVDAPRRRDCSSFPGG